MKGRGSGGGNQTCLERIVVVPVGCCSEHWQLKLGTWPGFDSWQLPIYLSPFASYITCL